MSETGAGSAESSAASALSSREIESWWKQTSPAISRLTKWMDSKEDWVVEPDDEFIEMLGEVVERVEHPAFVLSLEGDLAAEVAQLCALLNSSRFIRVLDMFDRRSPGIASRLVFVLGRLGGDTEVYSDLYCERLMVMHKFELMAFVFSPKRCQAISSAIRIVKGSEA